MRYGDRAESGVRRARMRAASVRLGATGIPFCTPGTDRALRTPRSGASGPAIARISGMGGGVRAARPGPPSPGGGR
jgi:hypothetical protein